MGWRTLTLPLSFADFPNMSSLSPGVKATLPSGTPHRYLVSLESQSLNWWLGKGLPSLASASCSVKWCLRLHDFPGLPARPPNLLPPHSSGKQSLLRRVSPQLRRTNGVNLALLCSDMPLPSPGEGRGFLKLAPVLSAEFCPDVSQEQAKFQ